MYASTRRVLLVPVALTVALLVGCSGGPGGEGELELVSTGSGEKADLTPAYEAGQQWDQAIQADVDLDLSGQQVAYGFRMDTLTRVVEAGEELVTLDQEVSKVTVTSAPEGADSALQSELSKLEGATLTTDYDRNGVQQGEATWEPELPDQQNTFSSLPAFPAEPVGEGAEWTVRSTMSPGNGIDDVQVDTTYELVSLDGDEYTLELTQSGEVDGEAEGVEVSGTFSGSGTATGTVGDPIPGSMEFTQEVSVEAQGQSLDMTTTLSYAPR